MTTRPTQPTQMPRRGAAGRAVGSFLALAGLAVGAAGQDSSVGPVFTEFGEGAVCEAPDAMVTIPVSADGYTLVNLIELLENNLRINVIMTLEDERRLIIKSPIDVRCDQMLSFVSELLDVWDLSITRLPSGVFTVQALDGLRPAFDGALSSTRIIRTPNVRPSGLQGAINALIGGTATQPGQAPDNSGLTVSYIDDLGVIVAKGTPARLSSLERLVEELLESYEQSTYHRISLEHVAAPVAQERTVELLGAPTTRTTARAGATPNQPVFSPTAGAAGSSRSITNIGERLSVDPQGNAIFFYGTSDEAEQVRELVSIIDVPNALEPRQYFAGSAATQIADFASRVGLGEVVRLGDDEQLPQFQVRGNAANFGSNDDETVGGPTMVVDERRGTILYYGTPSQQARLEELISQIDPEQERIVVETYRLRNADAEEVADLINGLIAEGATGDENSLLPNQVINRAGIIGFNTRDSGGDGGFTATSEDVFVIADIPNNQVVVKAPVVQQRQIAELIEQLDLRRAQVYIEATIVAIDDTDTFRFAVESQILAGQFGIQTDFGLSNTSTDFQTPRAINPNLPGLTTGLIRSDFVPFVINAIETDVRGRILSTPQVLVNDNEEATVVSTEEQPTATTSQGDGSTVTGFNDFQEAGTTLTVTPSISESGYIRLEYTVNLSNFLGAGTDVLPPARLTRELTGLVTIPSDSTVVLGGITVDNRQDSVSKIPLLGDLPIIGPLFSDTSSTDTGTILYVFITPRILADPDFNDLRLLTEGPQAEVGLDPDLPAMDPQVIDILAPAFAPPPDADGRDAPLGVAGDAAGDAPEPEPAQLIELPSRDPGARR